MIVSIRDIFQRTRRNQGGLRGLLVSRVLGRDREAVVVRVAARTDTVALIYRTQDHDADEQYRRRLHCPVRGERAVFRADEGPDLISKGHFLSPFRFPSTMVYL